MEKYFSLPPYIAPSGSADSSGAVKGAGGANGHSNGSGKSSSPTDQIIGDQRQQQQQQQHQSPNGDGTAASPYRPIKKLLPLIGSIRDPRVRSLFDEERDKETCFHTLMWALPALLRHLPLDQIVLALGCALTEMRIVVVGSDLSVVSSCVLALVNLLRPLKWAGPVIVTLPSTLHAYLGTVSVSYSYPHFYFHRF